MRQSTRKMCIRRLSILYFRYLQNGRSGKKGRRGKKGRQLRLGTQVGGEKETREQESNRLPVGSEVRALASQDVHLASDSYTLFTWASSSVFKYPIPPFVGALLPSGRMLFSESGLSEWSSTTNGFWLHWEQYLTSGGLSFPLCTVGTVMCLLPLGLLIEMTN